jgi:hypothetical protein
MTDQYNSKQIIKDICNAFGCSNSATEKINVSAGTFGTISLDLCNNCVAKFVQRKDKGEKQP